MLTTSLKSLYRIDLEKLAGDLSQYKDESKIWQVSTGIKNSAGNLTLHIVGNLNNYLGKILGNTGYVRNRDAEFSLKDVPRAELLKMIADTITMIEKVLDQLPPEQLAASYPEVVFDAPMTTEYFIVRLYGHLNYHYGQVNYHRRLLEQ